MIFPAGHGKAAIHLRLTAARDIGLHRILRGRRTVPGAAVAAAHIGVFRTDPGFSDITAVKEYARRLSFQPLVLWSASRHFWEIDGSGGGIAEKHPAGFAGQAGCVQQSQQRPPTATRAAGVVWVRSVSG